MPAPNPAPQPQQQKQPDNDLYKIGIKGDPNPDVSFQHVFVDLVPQVISQHAPALQAKLNEALKSFYGISVKDSITIKDRITKAFLIRCLDFAYKTGGYTYDLDDLIRRANEQTDSGSTQTADTLEKVISTINPYNSYDDGLRKIILKIQHDGRDEIFKNKIIKTIMLAKENPTNNYSSLKNSRILRAFRYFSKYPNAYPLNKEQGFANLKRNVISDLKSKNVDIVLEAFSVMHPVLSLRNAKANGEWDFKSLTYPADVKKKFIQITKDSDYKQKLAGHSNLFNLTSRITENNLQDKKYFNSELVRKRVEAFIEYTLPHIYAYAKKIGEEIHAGSLGWRIGKGIRKTFKSITTPKANF